MTSARRKGRSRWAGKTGPLPLAALVRRDDRDRYLTVLFAPTERREGLFALYAFNAEIARVRERVTQPMLGQIRLQWWREVVEAAYAGMPPRAHETAAPLAAAIRQFGLSRAALDRLIDAREMDLADAPPADLAALETYAEGTSATLVHLALEVLGAATPAALAAGREIGIAYALAGLLRALPFHARAGRSCIPQGVAVAAIGEAAAAHLAAARRSRKELPRAALPAMLPAIVAGHALARLRRAGWNPFDPLVAAPDPLLVWRLAAAMCFRRF
ncbi:MAG TPA: squalene/phytoene synthase family protein [Stellaceae bacterium]|nr:squalene/phytoene synthase family protein [Stellaceae bacterium]